MEYLIIGLAFLIPDVFIIVGIAYLIFKGFI